MNQAAKRNEQTARMARKRLGLLGWCLDGARLSGEKVGKPLKRHMPQSDDEERRFGAMDLVVAG